MDALSGYHQIPLAKEDQEKTSFVIATGLYYHNVMPFGLKKDGAMYQLLVYKVFATLIGKRMEVYVDDIITKSVKETDHVRELGETFKLLRSYALKLDPKKCTFGIRSGKFLGYMIYQ